MIKQNVDYQPFDGDNITMYPGISLGDRLMNMFERGVEDFDIQEKTYDDDDDNVVDPLADIRSDRFSLMDQGVILAQAPVIEPAPIDPASIEPAPIDPAPIVPAPVE